VLETKIIPIVRNHAISGHARINTEDELFDNAMAIRMALDVLSERGYHAMVDVHKNDIPDRVDPKTNRIICKQKRVYRFDVRFLASDIRRGP
jgi:adenylate kinase